MSWSYGIDESDREVGYGVEDICNKSGCKKVINRGLSYRCGGIINIHDDFGCGNFFCSNHLLVCRIVKTKNYKKIIWFLDQLCEHCANNTEVEDIEE